MAAAPPPTSSVAPLESSRLLPLTYVCGCTNDHHSMRTSAPLCWQWRGWAKTHHVTNSSCHRQPEGTTSHSMVLQRRPPRQRRCLSALQSPRRGIQRPEAGQQLIGTQLGILLCHRHHTQPGKQSHRHLLQPTDRVLGLKSSFWFLSCARGGLQCAARRLLCGRGADTRRDDEICMHEGKMSVQLQARHIDWWADAQSPLGPLS